MKLSTYIVEPYMVASFLMNDIARMCRQMVDQQVREIGLTRAQWYLLNFVYLYDGLSQQELANLLDLGKSNIAKQIHSLEGSGWIRRGPHETDGRSFRVYMDPDVRPTVEKLNRLVHLILQNVLEPLSDTEARKLITHLQGIDKHLEKLLRNISSTQSAETKKLLQEIRKEMQL